MSKLPNPAQPPTIMEANELARAPKVENKEKAHENEQAAQSGPTSLHNISLRASPDTTKIYSLAMSKLPNPAQPPTITKPTG